MISKILRNFKTEFKTVKDKLSLLVSTFGDVIVDKMHGEGESCFDIHSIEALLPEDWHIEDIIDKTPGYVLDVFEGTITGLNPGNCVNVKIELAKVSQGPTYNSFVLYVYPYYNGEYQITDAAVALYLNLEKHGNVHKIVKYHDSGDGFLTRMDGSPISIEQFVQSLDEPCSMYELAEKVTDLALVGPFSVEQLKEQIADGLGNISEIGQRFIADITSMVPPSELISPIQWVQLLRNWIKSLLSASLGEDNEISFTEDPTYSSVLWTTVVSATLNTMSTVLSAVMAVWTQVAGAVISVASSIFESIFGNLDADSGVTFNLNAPNTAVHLPIARISTMDSSLNGYTLTKNQGCAIMSLPMVKRNSWVSNDGVTVNQEIIPCLCYSRAQLASILAAIGINVTDTLSEIKTWDSTVPSDLNAGWFKATFVTPIEQDPLSFIDDITHIQGKLNVFKYVAIHIMVSAVCATPDSFWQANVYYPSYSVVRQEYQNGAISHLIKVLPACIREVIQANSVDGVMNELSFFIYNVCRNSQGLTSGVYNSLFKFDTQATSFGGYLYDMDSTLAGVTYGETESFRECMCVLPKFDAVLTAIATASVVVVMAIGAVAALKLRTAFKRKMQLKTIAKRQQLAQQKMSVNDAAMKYANGEITYAQYKEVGLPYLKSVRRYNMFAGFAGLAKVDAVSGMNINSLSTNPSQDGMAVNLEPIINLIKP